jgi:carbonic anhydrase
LVAASTIGLALGGAAGAKERKPPPKPDNVLSPDAALERLRQGNRRYVEGVSKRHDFKHEREALAGGQNPYAGILSCADSNTTLPGQMPSLVAGLAAAVKAASQLPGDLLGNAIKQNVIDTVAKLKSATPILSAAVEQRKLKIAGGIYRLRDGQVDMVA